MAAAKDVESWDDDLELEGPILTNSVSTYQNSVSSRLSLRSESDAGDWNVSLAPDDERSTSQAIRSAKLAGIPIPANTPPSALLGGTIKRLGPTKSPKVGNTSDWDDDLELPENGGAGLQLKKKEPVQSMEDQDDDFDWAEGSLGIRHGGTRRTFQTISPSFSFRSPSMGSVKTAESEDDGTGGLIFPTEPMDFEAALNKRRDAVPAEHMLANDGSTSRTSTMKVDHDDFLADIDFGTGDMFDTRKRALNRNLKQQWKPTEKTNNIQRAHTTLTFSDKAANTRIPRPVPPRAARLEPVFETGATNVTRTRRPEPTTTHAQVLRSKRSAPVLRQNQPAARPPPMPNMPPNLGHLSNRTNPARMSPYVRRESDPSRAQSPTLRAYSRLSNAAPPDTPARQRRDLASPALAREAAAKRQITRPAKKRNFGDGTELDTFDDLPTSASKESLFVKQPMLRGPSRLRPQTSQSKLGARDKMTTPMPQAVPKSPTKPEHLPRFARDTAASRIAREQTLGGTKQPKVEASGPLMPRPNHPSQPVFRTPQSSPTARRTLRKGPTLVAPMGKENIRHWQDDAAKKGMHWNPVLYKWEGNEKEIVGFDPAPPSPPRPALITNIGGAQLSGLVSGNMVFDNQAKRWLKLGNAAPDPRSPSFGDEDDPFQDIEDLKDELTSNDNGAFSGDSGTAGGSEWLVGEEFDLGPEFIRRQKDEETVWRQRTGAWSRSEGEGEGEEEEVEHKYAIREIAANAAM